MHRQRFEEQLTAIEYSPGLIHRKLDKRYKFREARHENGFLASAAGHLWMVKKENTDEKAANSDAASEILRITLPDVSAHLLNELNLLQQQYDQAHFEIGSLKQRVYGDWHKYMITTHPLESGRESYKNPSSDEIRDFIENNSLTLLKEKIARTGELRIKWNPDGSLQNAKAEVPGEYPELLERLLSSVHEMNPAQDSEELRILALEQTLAAGGRRSTKASADGIEKS